MWGNETSLSWNTFSRMCPKICMDFLLYLYLFLSSCQLYIKHKRADIAFTQKPVKILFSLLCISWKENWALINIANMGASSTEGKTELLSELLWTLYSCSPTEWIPSFAEISGKCHISHRMQRDKWCYSSICFLEMTVKGSCSWAITSRHKKREIFLVAWVPKASVRSEMVYKIHKLG